MRNLLFILLLLVCDKSSATEVWGGIYSNTTWTLANSPYVVNGDLVIFDGVTLEIEPGVEVLVDANLYIEVRGRLKAWGTPEKRITIKGNTTGNELNFWKGIKFIGTNTSSPKHQADLKHCNISNARTAIDMDIAYQGPYTFRNCSFTYNNEVNEDGGMHGVLFDSCYVGHNKKGINGFQFGGRVTNSLFEANGIGIDGTDSVINCRFYNHTQVALQPYGYTANCEVMNNKIGVKALFNSVNNTFINNVVKDNEIGLEIMSYFNSHNFQNNTICNNSVYNISLTTQMSNPNLANTCWCTTDSAAIRSKIHDGYVDVTKGLVSFMPVRTDCNSGISTSISNMQKGQVSSTPTIYPNPVMAGETLYIQANNNGAIINTVARDIMGKEVKMEMQRISRGKYEIHTRGIPAGLYFVGSRLEDGSEHTTKILIQ
jgi:hypothetical protein